MDLVVAELACGRGGLPVVEGVGFRLSPGEALVLTGPNGAGKTTLLRTLAGLLPPLAGRIEGAADRAAYAGHADAVKPTLTVAENLRFWAGLYGHGEIDGALAAFDLAPLAHRPARELSAGQRRRAGLARMVVTRRPVWLLDEPSVSLDAASTARLAGVLAGHLGAGGLAVIASHLDLGLAAARTLDLSPFRARALCNPFDGVTA